MRKLIFFDIDGTIVTDGNQGRIIPKSTVETIQKLQDNGHLCFINTGRAMSEVNSQITNLNFDGYICGCGTYITAHQEVLFSDSFPFSLGNQIIADLNACHLEWILEGIHSVYYSASPYYTHINDFKKEHSQEIPDKCTILTPDAMKDIPFDKFCICLGKDSNFSVFHEKYKDTLSFIDRGNGFYEIMPISCSKASGIAFLEKYYGIPHEDTIAIGDSTNDLPMLNYAGFSIAMGNSAKELFPVVDYVTKDLLEDGIYHAMKHLQLI